MIIRYNELFEGINISNDAKNELRQRLDSMLNVFNYTIRKHELARGCTTKQVTYLTSFSNVAWESDITANDFEEIAKKISRSDMGYLLSEARDNRKISIKFEGE